MILEYKPRILYPNISNGDIRLWCNLQRAGWTIDWFSPHHSETLRAACAYIEVSHLREGLKAWEDATNMTVGERGRGYSLEHNGRAMLASVTNTYYHLFTIRHNDGTSAPLMGSALKRASKVRISR